MTEPPSVPPAALAIAPIGEADVASVATLWQRCGLTRPWNDPQADIALARRSPNATILVGRDGNGIVASAMTATAAGSITLRSIPTTAEEPLVAPS